MTVNRRAAAAAGGATPWRVSGEQTDFFISHADRDTAWAEWLAWQLQQAGYRVELAVGDWAPGEDFVARMSAALERADRLLAVCTQAYFASAFGGAELCAFRASRRWGGPCRCSSSRSPSRRWVEGELRARSAQL